MKVERESDLRVLQIKSNMIEELTSQPGSPAPRPSPIVSRLSLRSLSEPQAAERASGFQGLSINAVHQPEPPGPPDPLGVCHTLNTLGAGPGGTGGYHQEGRQALGVLRSLGVAGAWWSLVCVNKGTLRGIRRPLKLVAKFSFLLSRVSCVCVCVVAPPGVFEPIKSSLYRNNRQPYGTCKYCQCAPEASRGGRRST